MEGGAGIAGFILKAFWTVSWVGAELWTWSRAGAELRGWFWIIDGQRFEIPGLLKFNPVDSTGVLPTTLLEGTGFLSNPLEGTVVAPTKLSEGTGNSPMSPEEGIGKMPLSNMEGTG